MCVKADPPILLATWCITHFGNNIIKTELVQEVRHRMIVLDTLQDSLPGSSGAAWGLRETQMHSLCDHVAVTEGLISRKGSPAGSKVVALGGAACHGSLCVG